MTIQIGACLSQLGRIYAMQTNAHGAHAQAVAIAHDDGLGAWADW